MPQAVGIVGWEAMPSWLGILGGGELTVAAGYCYRGIWRN